MHASVGLLQPLPIPTQIWDTITMDFITALASSHGFTTIMVVVDILCKYAHFGALPLNFMVEKTTTLFIEVVVKLHGFPVKIISDCDLIFINAFWSELFKQSGTTLKQSMVYHPQTDGQSDVVNRGLDS